MEGPFLLLKACVLCWLMVAAYRRFERFGPRDPAFRVRCRAEIVLATARGPRVRTAQTALAAAFADGVIATLGLAPWPWHALSVAVESPSEAEVVVRVVDAERIRVRGPAKPALVEVLTSVLPADCELWLHPEAFVDVLSDDPMPALGWVRREDRFHPAAAVKVRA